MNRNSLQIFFLSFPWLIAGLIVGAIIRYASDEKETSHLFVSPTFDRNQSMPTSPPDNVFLQLDVPKSAVEVGKVCELELELRWFSILTLSLLNDSKE